MGADTIYGGTGADRIGGGPGRDRIRAGFDGVRDVVDGGPGVDVCWVRPSDRVRRCEQVLRDGLRGNGPVLGGAAER